MAGPAEFAFRRESSFCTQMATSRVEEMVIASIQLARPTGGAK